MVLYAGIDVGKYKHEITFLSESGEQVGNTLVFDNSQRGMKKLLSQALKNDPERLIFGLEATWHYWLPLYTQLTAAGYDVNVINPIQSDSLRNLYIRVTKNDRKDSFLIAEVLRFERLHRDQGGRRTTDLAHGTVPDACRVPAKCRRHQDPYHRPAGSFFFSEFERCFSKPCSATAQ